LKDIHSKVAGVRHRRPSRGGQRVTGKNLDLEWNARQALALWQINNVTLVLFVYAIRRQPMPIF